MQSDIVQFLAHEWESRVHVLPQIILNEEGTIGVAVERKLRVHMQTLLQFNDISSRHQNDFYERMRIEHPDDYERGHSTPVFVDADRSLGLKRRELPDWHH
ncbi:hypothetical protein ACQZ5N_01015 [Agrobacterium sp. 22-221-1]